jgi:hypothetical protein
MKALIQRTIDLLKKRVKENLETINQNQIRLNEMLNQTVSAERTYQIEKNYAANKALLAENNDFISLQLSLLNFLDRNKDSLSRREKKEESPEPATLAFIDEEEIFELTIQGKLSFENGHPKFEDEAFFNKLLSYYASIEAYEKCNAIMGPRKKNQVS